MTPRIPPDDPSDEGYGLPQRHAYPSPNYGNIAGAVPTSGLTNLLLTIVGGLAIAGVIGEVKLYAQMSAMQSTLDLIVAGKIVIFKMP